MSGDIKIKVRGLCKAFGRKVVLRDLDLDVPKGQSLVVIGGSGTGKSVLIKCIIGLMKPDKGSIEIDGHEVTRMSSSEREEIMHKFGMLFQGGALFDSLKVWENVAFGLIQGRKMQRDEAHAIAIEPEIIFFDEPTTGLDPIMSQVINELIKKCVDDLGATALSITHDMHSLRVIGDNAAMIYDGRIIWHGPAADIDHSGNAHVEQFVQGRAEGPIKMPVRPL